MREPNLDPDVEALVRNVMGAVDEVRTARIRLENVDVPAVLHEPTEVTQEFMSDLAASEVASPALRAYADRVRNGECFWWEIEVRARPVPPEVADLKNSPNFLWRWNPEPPPVENPPPPRPSPIPGGEVVGPSDWPDDLDEYPGTKSWLV